jgi:hypothetical protein
MVGGGCLVVVDGGDDGGGGGGCHHRRHGWRDSKRETAYEIRITLTTFGLARSKI